MTAQPIDLPAGHRRPILVSGLTVAPIEAPSEPAAAELFQTEDGKRWRLAGTDSDGRLFVPAHLDPAKIKRWVWATEAYLLESCGAMTPVGGAA